VTCKREFPDPPGTTCVHCGTPITKGARSARDPLVGTEVAQRFRVEELIGQGGMGKVYRARHLSLDKLVCLKMLKTSLLDDPTVVGRFEREAKAASRINHANCIQVLDFGRNGEEGTLFIAMEYVQGKDLRIVLRDEWPLDEARLCHIMAQVCSALAEAHSQNVLHRDLKPENIMVEQRRGQPDFVKVLDFGIAKIMDSDAPGLTRADVVCGTPQYMAPEQATGSPLDARADLYALGVILYQLTTGHLPFDGQNSMEVLTKHVNEVPVPPRQKMPEAVISEAMEQLILRTLQKDPALRPQSALELQEALRGIAAMHARDEGLEPSARLSDGTIARAGAETLPSLPLEVADATPRAKKPLLIGAALAVAAVVALGLAVAGSRGSATATPIGLSGSGSKPEKVPKAEPRSPTTTTAPSAAHDPKKAVELVAQARQFQLDGNTAAARDVLEAAVEADEGNAEAHFRLGNLFSQTRPAQARPHFERARALDPEKYGEQVELILGTLR
jgi:tRNA A-37 threonylcarbamoyl transferase component Bud32